MIYFLCTVTVLTAPFLLYLNCMEKSMVHELSSMTHSTVFSSRPSFLFPSDPDRLQLRRSRIQNLPGYKKEDLSGKLNFVVVFQTIEIERLSQQIETLRIMARDWDRQRLNYENYEVQIRELTEKCHFFEMHREGIEEELERMKDFCEKLVVQVEESRLKSREYEPGLKEKYQLERARNDQLQVEVDRWRNRYSSLEVSRTKELEEVRNDLESRRRSQINRETRELAIKHENQLSSLNSDLRKTREECQLRQSEIGRLEELIGKFQLREEEMREIQEKMYDYENKFVLLSQENYRLNQLLRRRGEELDRMKRAEKEVRTKAQSTTHFQEQIRRLQIQITTRNKSIEQLSLQLQSFSQANERLGYECQKAQSYEQLINQLQVQVQRLNQIMRDKISECDQLKTSNKLMESKISASTSATQKEFANYEDRIVAFTKEQERQNAQLKHRLAENQQLKVRCSEFEREIVFIQNLRQENEALRGQLGQNNNKIEEFKRKIQLLEENLTLMEDIEKKLHQEEQIRRQLLADRERMNNSLREMTIKVETYQQKATAAQQELAKYSNNDKELTDYKKRIAWMTQELDRINGEIQIRVTEIQQLKENYRSLGNSKVNYQNIEQRLIQNLTQIQQLVLDLDTSRRENDRLQNDNMNMSITIKGLQGQVIGLVEERDQRNRSFSVQSVELQQLRQKIEYYANEVKSRQGLEQAVQESQKKMEAMRGMMGQMQERLAMESQQNQALSMEIMQLKNQPRVSKELSEELIIVRKQSQEQRMLISFLFQRIDNIQNILNLLKQNYANGMLQLQNIRQKAASLSVNSQCIDEIYVVFNSYIQKIDLLRQENLRLQSERALSGVEYCQSMRVLQEGAISLPQTSIKNSSIALKVTSDQVFKTSKSENNLFTFKDTSRDRSNLDNNAIYQRQQQQENQEARYSDQFRDGSSMASSFINTLITKQSTNRFQNRIAADNQTTSFGYNQNSKLRYPPAVHYQGRFKEEFLPIETQIQNIPTQINRAVSPVQRVSLFDNSSIKRVTSYTHFTPTFNPNHSPSQGPSPTIRVQQIHRFPDTANSTSESCSQLGKRIRIPADPARLLQYRQQ